MDIEDRNTEALPDGDEPALETLDLSTREILAGLLARSSLAR
jgi:hypothetical protein